MGIKQIIKNDYTLSVATQITTAIVGVISSAFSTRYLGVEYKGDYGYISQVANIIVLILNLGIYQSFSYNYKKYGHDIIYKYINIIFFQFVVLLSVMIILQIIIKDLIFCMIIVLVPFNILKLQYNNIVLIEKIRLYFFFSVFNSVFSTLCFIGLYLWVTPGIIYMVMLTVIVDIITIVAYTTYLKIVPRFWRVDFSFLKSILRFGFIPMLSALLATINYSIDIVFIKNMGLHEELSYYTLAASIIGYVWLLPDAFKSVLFSKSGKKFDKENIVFSSQISIFFIFLCLIGFAMFGRFFIKLMYGVAFLDSYTVTILLMLGAFSMSVYKILGIVLVSQGRRYAHFASLLISALINIFLNMLLIPQIGMYGAAIASVCSYTVCGGILLIYFCKIYNMNPIHLLFISKNSIHLIGNKIHTIKKK